MTNTIKLTKEMFSGYTRNEYDNLIEICIYADDIKQCKIIENKILDNQEKAEKFDNLIPVLKDMLTEKQLDLLDIMVDSLSRKILSYLSVGNKPNNLTEDITNSKSIKSHDERKGQWLYNEIREGKIGYTDGKKQFIGDRIRNMTNDEFDKIMKGYDK